MSDVTDEQLAEWEALAEAFQADSRAQRLHDPVQTFILANEAAKIVRALRDARDEAAREPVRTAIEYDHWRDAAIANRNEADALRERLAAVEALLCDFAATWLIPVERIRAALAAPTGQEAQE